ncbi:MAG: dTMP kinase [Actinomycetota bacterium]|nr:dTMP kinase [Actinomycetota bacterium]
MDSRAAGRFVVLEGGDASGKSTQAALLVERLRGLGRDVVLTFEPGATEAGAAIRELLLHSAGSIEPLAETLLLAADRAQEVADIVRPTLARGADVVSDRYVPSSLAYQGVGRGLGIEKVEKLNRWATGGLEPDVVVVLDVDDAVAASRRAVPGDRLERAGAEFHAAVRNAYRSLAAERGWALVDGNADVDVVAERVWGVVRERLEL